MRLLEKADKPVDTPLHINKSGSIPPLNVSRTDVFFIQKMDLRDKNIVEIIARVIEEGKTLNRSYYCLYIYIFAMFCFSMLYTQLQTQMITKDC